MPSPNHPALEQLRRLDRSLSGFHDQLCNVFYGKEYQGCVPNLQGGDSAWLVDYLDEVRAASLPFPTLRLSYADSRRSGSLQSRFPEVST